MNEREFLDLLRYYFRKVKPEDVEEILSDYKAHFTEARERGLSDAQIAAELGHPEDIYASYQSEGIVSEKTKMEKISDNAEYLADKAQQRMQQTWNEVSLSHSGRCQCNSICPCQSVFYPLYGSVHIPFRGHAAYHLSIIYAFYSHYGCGSLTGTPPADHGRSGGNRMFCQSFHFLHGDVGQKVS